jgi:hypothetical protein
VNVAGTQLQEIGHDAVIVAFIQKVLSSLHAGAIYLVNPAMGPKRDVYFFDESERKYVSACSLAGPNYIPEFQYRFLISAADMAQLEKDSNWRQEGWYRYLSERIGRDLHSHVSQMCETLESDLQSDLPDIIAIDNDARIVAFAEVKFEGFSSKAKDSVLKEFDTAKTMNVPYYLAIPKHPSYSRELTRAWIERNLPPDLALYKFTAPKNTVLPRQDQIDFVHVVCGLKTEPRPSQSEI